VPELEAESVARRPPSGTVTFLFTDIEGSTKRWERDREAMSDALARHDVLVRAALEARGGFVFKTVGDAFCAAFETAPQALAAALDVQRAIGGADWRAVEGLRVRIALHTADADVRDGDYFGPALNRVARLLATAHGGQIVVSANTALLGGAALPPQAILFDLGQHRLKDLARPEHVYQLGAPGLQATFPALRSLSLASNNLPLQVTSLIGRDDDLAAIRAALETARLVTIVGAGGIGKTRTALAVGEALIVDGEAPVRFVELAPLAHGSAVGAAVAQSLGLQESPGKSVFETLRDYLAQLSMLLILDNGEHVIADVAALAGALLRYCPHVRMLVTSREPLRIAGEQTYRLPSLRLPSAAQSVSLVAPQAAEFAAVALFVERARARNPAFALDDGNAPAVAEICRRLDGIPLAIELGAARLNVLSVDALLTNLDRRFALLTGGDRTALPRHQTMRALIDWSFDLLDEAEQRLFKRLSVFTGGFDLAAAAAIDPDAGGELGVLELLSSLADKSLLVVEVISGEPRYRLLESTRAYAREKLTSDEAAGVAHRHALAYTGLAERLREKEGSVSDAELDRAEIELDNWRAALDWTLAGRGDVALGQRLAAAISWVWRGVSLVEGRRWLGLALGLADAGTPARLRADLECGLTLLNAGLGEWESVLAESRRLIDTFEELGDAMLLAQTQILAGKALLCLGRAAESEPLLRSARSGALRFGNLRMAAEAVDNLAYARSSVGNLEDARTCIAESQEIWLSLGADRAAASSALVLAEAEFLAGNGERALDLVASALTTLRERPVARHLTMALLNQAAYYIAADRWSEAREAAREALGLAPETQRKVWPAWAIAHLAAVAALSAADSRERVAVAAQLLGFVDARVEEFGARREYTEQQEYDRVCETLRKTFGPDELTELMRAGAALSPERATALALSI
jgi:predicted ATPase/class 3 adenylate cyclase